MKNLIGILAASALAALSVPVAGAMIPGDSRSGSDGVTQQQLVKHVTQTPTKQSIKGIRYHLQAYVPGGSSPAVAKAIVSQGKRVLR